MNEPGLKNRLLWGLAITLVTGVAVAGALLTVSASAPARHSSMTCSCADNLRTIESAAMTYYAAAGRFPASIGELVPDYLKGYPECPRGGSYSLDCSGTCLEARCSYHGTVADYYPGPKWKEIDWPALFAKLTLFLTALGEAAILILLSRTRGPESAWGRYGVSIVLWLGALLILAGMLPFIEFVRGLEDIAVLGSITLALMMLPVIAGFVRLKGRKSKAFLVISISLFLLLAGLMTLNVVFEEIEAIEIDYYEYNGHNLNSMSWWSYLMAGGAIISLLGFIAALLERKGAGAPGPAPVQISATQPFTATVSARSR